MFRSTFRVAGETPYERLTGVGGASVDLWCSEHSDLLVVSGSDDPAATSAVEDSVGVRDRLVDDGRQLVVTEDCLMDHREETVESHLAANDCLLVPPIRYEAGETVVRVLAPEASNLTGLYHDLADAGSVTVTSKARLSEVTAGSSLLFGASVKPSLSRRQREAFLTAHERGYYEMPRETTTAEIADAVGVNRRTVEHHLREAERKIADRAVQYV